MLDPHAGALLNTVSPILLFALGVAVLAVRPRRPANVALGTYATVWAVALVLNNLPDLLPTGQPLALPLLLVSGLVYAVAGGALLRLGAVWPSPVPARTMLAAASVPVVAGIASFALLARMPEDSPALAYFGGRNSALLFFAFAAVFFVAAQTCVLLLGLRYRSVPPARRPPMALVAAALAMYLGFADATWLVGIYPEAPFGLPSLGVTAVCVLVWLRASAGPNARPAVATALAPLAAGVAAMLLAVATPQWTPSVAGGGWGVVRTVSVGLLAYAILRHQLLDVDVKIKWTVKRGTLAAVFLAVFFAAAQVAENVFSDRYGLLVGGAAAGLLVFAIAPLQRVAERVASAAVPGLGDLDAPRAPRGLDAYRYSVRLALADGVLTREEERYLAELARDLGIDYARALALREEVEAEAARPA